MSARKRAVIISAAHAVEYPSLEFHLVRTGKFFARENIFTAFPECHTFCEQLGPGKSAVYLLCSFQPNDGEMLPATEEEMRSEREALEKGLGSAATHVAADSDTQFSYLTSYAPESFTWKDNSRDVFFAFMSRVQSVLEKAFAERRGLFLDWPDPASGLPMHTHRGSSILVENDVMEQYFSFQSVLIACAGGGCRVTDHPVYGWNMYPASAVISIAAEDEGVLRDALLSML